MKQQRSLQQSLWEENVREMDSTAVTAKSILTPCGFGGWSLNPYVGCSHACAYCYVRRRWNRMEAAESHVHPWGAFVQVKINAMDRLRREIHRVSPGEGIWLSSATDAYQPQEAQRCHTRKILEMLVDWDVKITILTKSALVVRDIDLFQHFRNLRVGFSINTLDRHAWQCIEMNSSPPEERLEALEILQREHISTFVFMSPAMPFITDFDTMVPVLAKRTRRVSAETLNLSEGNYAAMREAIQRFMPGREQDFWQAVVTRKWGNTIAKQFEPLCKQYGVRFGGFFRNECSRKKLKQMFSDDPIFDFLRENE